MYIFVHKCRSTIIIRYDSRFKLLRKFIDHNFSFAQHNDANLYEDYSYMLEDEYVLKIASVDPCDSLTF